MLCAIAGSQGSGKSSLIEQLKLLGYQSIERKTSRSILTDWGVTLSEVNNNRDLTIKFQDEILKRKLDDENAALSGLTPIITERTYIDLLTYAVVAIGKDNEYDEWLDSYAERCFEAMKTYTSIFYLESGLFPVVGDGVRGVNSYYSELVDVTMKHYYTKYAAPHIPTHFVHIADLQSRTQYVSSTIQEHVNILSN